MNFTFRIAWRYIFSKKSTNVINIIAGITMTGIVIGSAALIIVLSAFNGFETLVLRLYSSFYPDITVTPVQGKVFTADSLFLSQIKTIEGIQVISQTLEENALVAYDDEEHIATIKGVDVNYQSATAVDDSVFIGDYILAYDNFGSSIDCAVLGSGVAATLDVGIGIEYPAIQIFMPRRGIKYSFNPGDAFIQKGVVATGVFRIQQEFDSKYMIVSLQVAQNLMEYKNNELSKLEIKVSSGYNAEVVRKKIQAIVGEKYAVKNRVMQNEFLYKVMRNERWVVFLILTFILIIATFNMIGSISMLVIDKRKDIGILRSLGATENKIRNIFFIQGVLQTLVSITIGFFVATILCLLQMRFEIITIPGSGSFVITAYPIDLKLMDYIYVFFTIFIIGSIASYFPAALASRQRWMFKEE
ncbi:MAG: ABC transporter permease [Fimbriimonadaceae bacterium]|nr:ABC transporter permease [Chitinophagales bacterium]